MPPTLKINFSRSVAGGFPLSCPGGPGVGSRFTWIRGVGGFFRKGSILEVFSGGPSGLVFGRLPADLGVNLGQFRTTFGTISAPFFQSIVSFRFVLILWSIYVPLIVPKNNFNVILSAKIEKSQVSICSICLVHFCIRFSIKFGWLCRVPGKTER